MSTKSLKNTEQWIDYIANKELPAITSTAHLLEKFANDDISSLPKLSQVILHDQGLSSCVLKVANSLPHLSFSRVTTVSRATVVLGIQSVKNICLTSKLIEGLLRSKNLSPEVYQHICQLMASSFYAGTLAKMMVADYNEDTQEQVYLAALLYRIGETAFWSFAGDSAEQLITKIHRPIPEFEQAFADTIGTSFTLLTQGLAKNWKLSELLLKSLDAPESRTVEMQIIYLADKLSRYIARPPSSIHDFNTVLSDISQIMQISTKQLRERINRTKEQAIQLLVSYGAGTLSKKIKSLPTIQDFVEQTNQPLESEISREKLQLLALKQLVDMTQQSKNLNDYLIHTVRSIAKTVGFSRCSFIMLTNNKQVAEVRFTYDSKGVENQLNTKINLILSDNIITHCLKLKQALLVNDYQAAQWRDFMTRELIALIDESSFCLAPINIDQKTIGLVLALNQDHGLHISHDDFASFSLFISQLNLCLSLLAK